MKNNPSKYEVSNCKEANLSAAISLLSYCIAKKSCALTLQ